MLGWETEGTDESVKADQNWYVRPVVKESFENIVILNELLAFLVRVANPPAGVDAPVDVTVPVVVFRQKAGVIVQPGIVSSVVSEIK